jgi:hypothetical protein
MAPQIKTLTLSRLDTVIARIGPNHLSSSPTATISAVMSGDCVGVSFNAYGDTPDQQVVIRIDLDCEQISMLTGMLSLMETTLRDRQTNEKESS